MQADVPSPEGSVAPDGHRPVVPLCCGGRLASGVALLLLPVVVGADGREGGGGLLAVFFSLLLLLWWVRWVRGALPPPGGEGDVTHGHPKALRK